MKIFPLVVTLCLLAMPVQADSIVGTWTTEPDSKAQTGHVVITPCAEFFCGTVARAFDKNGKPVVTPNVGKRILWNVSMQGNDGNGQVYIPLLHNEFPVKLSLRGTSLNVKACNNLGVCRTQVWKRFN